MLLEASNHRRNSEELEGRWSHRSAFARLEPVPEATGIWDSLAVLNLFVDSDGILCANFVTFDLGRQIFGVQRDMFYDGSTNPKKLSLDFRLHGWI